MEEGFDWKNTGLITFVHMIQGILLHVIIASEPIIVLGGIPREIPRIFTGSRYQLVAIIDSYKLTQNLIVCWHHRNIPGFSPHKSIDSVYLFYCHRIYSEVLKTRLIV